MSTTVSHCFIILLMLPGIVESTSCEDMKDLAERKDNAYKTLCTTGNNLAKCCNKLASEVKKLGDSYKPLCQLSGKFVNKYTEHQQNIYKICVAWAQIIQNGGEII